MYFFQFYGTMNAAMARGSELFTPMLSTKLGNKNSQPLPAQHHWKCHQLSAAAMAGVHQSIMRVPHFVILIAFTFLLIKAFSATIPPTSLPNSSSHEFIISK